MDNKDLINILELAVKCHHEFLKEHSLKACNCFREKFGKLLMKEYDVKLYGEKKENDKEI